MILALQLSVNQIGNAVVYHQHFEVVLLEVYIQDFGDGIVMLHWCKHSNECLFLQDQQILGCAQLPLMIVIAERLLLQIYVFKYVSWLAEDSRLQQTFSIIIDLVEWRSRYSICPSSTISEAAGPLKPLLALPQVGLSLLLLYFHQKGINMLHLQWRNTEQSSLVGGRGSEKGGPQLFSPACPSQSVRVWCLFRHSLRLSPVRPPAHEYPGRVPVKTTW